MSSYQVWQLLCGHPRPNSPVRAAREGRAVQENRQTYGGGATSLSLEVEVVQTDGLSISKVSDFLMESID